MYQQFKIMKKKKKRVFIDQSNYKYKGGEVNDEQSRTIPNQSFTVRELIKKHQQGIAPAVMKRALYEIDDFGEELNPLRKQGFDLSDIDKLSRQIKAANKVVQKQKQLEAEEEQRKQKELIIDDYLKENKLGKYKPKEEKES